MPSTDPFEHNVKAILNKLTYELLETYTQAAAKKYGNPLTRGKLQSRLGKLASHSAFPGYALFVLFAGEGSDNVKSFKHRLLSEFSPISALTDRASAKMIRTVQKILANVVYENGDTPLHLAVKDKDLTTVRALITYGDMNIMNIEDREGNWPAQYCGSSPEHTEVLPLLLSQDEPAARNGAAPEKTTGSARAAAASAAGGVVSIGASVAGALRKVWDTRTQRTHTELPQRAKNGPHTQTADGEPSFSADDNSAASVYDHL